MTTPAAFPLSASFAHHADETGIEQWSPALASLSTPLWLSGLVMAAVVALVQLSLRGYEPAFASTFLENWLVAWAVAFPVFYVLAAPLRRALAFLSSPPETNERDIAPLIAHKHARGEFSVQRNLKVREGFYRG